MCKLHLGGISVDMWRMLEDDMTCHERSCLDKCIAMQLDRNVITVCRSVWENSEEAGKVEWKCARARAFAGQSPRSGLLPWQLSQWFPSLFNSLHFHPAVPSIRGAIYQSGVTREPGRWVWEREAEHKEGVGDGRKEAKRELLVRRCKRQAFLIVAVFKCMPSVNHWP